MKIGQPGDASVASSATAGPAPAADVAGKAAPTASPAAVPATADPSATVALSTTAASLLSAGGSADFDAAKVAAMAERIANGTFTVNADAIADKLIANAQELLANVKA